MSSKVPIRVNIDSDLKNKAEVLYKDLGLNMSVAITMFLKQSVREQAIPFRVAKNRVNSETLKAIKDVEEGKVTGPFKNVEDLMRSLNA